MVAVVVTGSSAARKAAPRVPICRPGDGALHVTGRLGPNSENTYKLVPFRVARGTTRVEVGYGYSSEGTGETVLDLGLWDEDGYRTVGGFRGWSGSRHGNLDEGERPIHVQRNSAARNFNHGRVRPGKWHVELGVGAIGSEGSRWRVRIRCRSRRVGPRPAADPVDRTHVARDEPGWYHGDFHMHAFHSNPKGPTQKEFVSFARAAGLDFMPITEYVINRHWNEWGKTARANPDLLFWPGREVITYFGHAIVIGETPTVIDYRHGFKDVTLGDIQVASVDGALFGIAHPTLFPPPLDDLCRGCYFELSNDIDWTKVDTVEVLTGPIIVEGGFPNPFVPTAIEFWEDRLEQGFKITAVSGSDDKLGPGLGSSATAVYADELSRSALKEAIRAGHAYVQTLGVDESPALDLLATTSDAQSGMFGDTLNTDSAEVTVTVTDGDGQTLRIYRDGVLFGTVPIVGDDFSHTFTATRDETSGPLGTFYRVETFNGQVQTTIANPIFLDDPTPPR